MYASIRPTTHFLLQPMLPTYVFGWPTGKETGDYLAIDLGVCVADRTVK